MPGALSRIDWRSYVPPLTSRTFLAHYLPVCGALSHSAFTVHIFSPSIVSRLFPVGDLAVSNTILFTSNIGLGFYVFFRRHMHRLNSWERVEYSVFCTTMFNFGSLLASVFVKALLPNKTATWIRSCVALSLSAFLLSRGAKYLHFIDARSARGSPSPRISPIKDFERNGHSLNSNGVAHSPSSSSGYQNGNGSHHVSSSQDH